MRDVSTTIAAAVVLLGATGCASKRPCPTASPAKWSQFYDSVSVEASEEATQTPLPNRVAAVVQCQHDPCEDFYAYACGGWLDSKDRNYAGRGVGLQEIRALNVMWVRDIIQVAEDTAEQSADRALLADFAMACRSDRTRALGRRQVLQWLDQAAAVSEPDEVASFLGDLLFYGGAPFFITSESKSGHGSGRALFATLPATGMHAFRYQDMQTVGRYVRLVEQSFVEMGRSDERAQRMARHVVALETALAALESEAEERSAAGDRRAQPIDISREPQLLSWGPFKTVLGVDASTPILHHDAELVRSVFEVWNDPANHAAYRAYLQWNIVRVNAAALGGRLARLHDRFFRGQLLGHTWDVPDWYRCSASAQRWLVDVIDRYYVGLTYDRQHLAAKKLVKQVRSAFRNRLEHASWLDAMTRAAALKKLDLMNMRVGHPRRFPKFADPPTLGKDHAINVMNLRRLHQMAAISTLTAAIDDTWPSVSQANAYYNTNRNEATVLAGLLQPPFFGVDVPPVVNLAHVGVVVGHEVTHGFDNDGRLHDAQGRYLDWWSDDARTQFETRAQCVVDAYDGLEVTRDARLDGVRTLGENIADLGGVAAAWDAWASIRESGQARKVEVKGLTNDQLFFVSYAQTWCSEYEDAVLETRSATDPHSSNRHRVNVVLANFEPFSEAFACPPDAPMNPPNKCEVW